MTFKNKYYVLGNRFKWLQAQRQATYSLWKNNLSIIYVYSGDQNSIAQSLIKAILEEIMEQLLTPSRITSTADTLGWDQIMHEFIWNKLKTTSKKWNTMNLSQQTTKDC